LTSCVIKSSYNDGWTRCSIYMYVSQPRYIKSTPSVVIYKRNPLFRYINYTMNLENEFLLIYYNRGSIRMKKFSREGKHTYIDEWYIVKRDIVSACSKSKLEVSY
jgi:hypothetical protein